MPSKESLKDLEKEAEEEEQRVLQQSVGELAYIHFCSVSLWGKKQLSRSLSGLVEGCSEQELGARDWSAGMGTYSGTSGESQAFSNLQLPGL